VDATVVSRPQHAKQPKTRQLHNLTGVGALAGTFWGKPFGLMLFVSLAAP
jgi:uncharacterized membrane protein